ncbi:MAG: hypothetical protein AAFY48_21105, partial [Bacteroidota bacterium]
MNLAQKLELYFRNGSPELMAKVQTALQEHLGDLSAISAEQILDWPLDILIHRLGIHLHLDFNGVQNDEQEKQVQCLKGIVATIIIDCTQEIHKHDPLQAAYFIRNTDEIFQLKKFIHPQLGSIIDHIPFEKLKERYPIPEVEPLQDDLKPYLEWQGNKHQLNQLAGMLKSDYSLILEIPSFRKFLNGDNKQYIVANEIKVYELICLLEALKSKGWIKLKGKNAFNKLLTRRLYNENREPITQDERYYSDIKYKAKKNEREQTL